MIAIPLYYEIPLFLFIFVAIFVIKQIMKVDKNFAEGDLKESYNWLMLSSVFFTLWAVMHLYADLFKMPSGQELFFHYVISHGFLLISMMCLGMSALKTQRAYTTGKWVCKKGK